jgi:uncharacterized membrane protein
VLLLLWLADRFLRTVYFARELAGLSVFGWPLSFYLAAQGASLVYLAHHRLLRLAHAPARPGAAARHFSHPATPPHPEHRA